MERIITESYVKDDDFDLNLRPKFLKEYIGQKEVKENIDIFIKACITLI